MVLGFAKALGEFGATVTFGVVNIPGETQTYLLGDLFAESRRPDGDNAALRPGSSRCPSRSRWLALVAAEWLARRASNKHACMGKRAMPRVERHQQLGEFSLRSIFCQRGRVTALFGPSGAGKTSADQRDRRAPAPRARPHSPSTAETLDDTADNLSVPAHRRRIGYVFQDAAAISASRRAPQSRLRAAHEPVWPGDPAQRTPRDRPARHRPFARSPPRQAVRRRAPARGGRTRAAGAAAATAARRALGCAGRGAQSWRSCPIWRGCATRRANVPMIYVSHDARRDAAIGDAGPDAPGAGG